MVGKIDDVESRLTWDLKVHQYDSIIEAWVKYIMFDFQNYRKWELKTNYLWEKNLFEFLNL